MKTCENCGCEHDGTYGSGRFCSTKCSRAFSTKAKRQEINEKVSNTLTGRSLTEEHKHKISINNGSRKYKNGKESPLKGRILGKRKYPRNYDYSGVKVIKLCKHCGTNSEILVYSNICDNCKGEYRVYKEKCIFKFNLFDYPDLFNLDLIYEHGFYSASNTKNPNLNGVSRDHKISVKYGYENNINPYIISHPLNCELLLHKDNQIKKSNCSISVEELEQLIKTFDYGQVPERSKGTVCKTDY